MKQMIAALLAFLTLTLCVAGPAQAYPVGPALSLEKLQEKSDFICKAVVVSSKPVVDPWFESTSGFSVVSTELKIIEVYKGAALGKASFHHYSIQGDAAFNFMPQHYEFQTGRAYVIFASATSDPSVFRQFTRNHTIQEDQGALLAADEVPHPGQSIAEVYWAELSSLLTSKSLADVKYAVQHLNRMSSGLRSDEPAEFKRDDVLKAVAPLLSHNNPDIVEQAILALGASNPLMDPGNAPHWLVEVGDGHIPGYSGWSESGRPRTNEGGRQYWKELSEIADRNTDVRVRSLAIRALGQTSLPEIRPLALRWMQDKSPEVAQAALLLLSNVYQSTDDPLLSKMALDSRDAVRTGVATTIGYARAKSLIPLLGQMINDPSHHVSSAAALSLLSFSLKDSDATLKANVKHPQFGSLFVNALAHRDGLAYSDELCAIIQNNLQPEHWWGGFVTWGDSWQILFKAARQASREQLESKPFEKILTALEAPASGAPQSPQFYSSSEPRNLYALYLHKGLRDRARQFRAQCRKTITYDIDYYFKMADENPSLYIRDQ